MKAILKVRKHLEFIVILNQMDKALAFCDPFYVTIQNPVTVDELAAINEIYQNFETWILSAREL